MRHAIKNQSQTYLLLSLVSLIVSFVAGILLAIESYLNLHGSSLCNTTACNVVSNYITVDAHLLVAGGGLFFLLLSLSIYLSYKHSRRLSFLPFVLLIPALLFDASLIGFQVFTIKQFCLICISVAGTLIILSILLCASSNRLVLLCCLLLAWIGSFSSHVLMKTPVTPDLIGKIAFFEKNADIQSKNSPTVTLIISMNCPHCLKLVSELGKLNTSKLNWRLASTDHDIESIGKIYYFKDNALNTKNVFTFLEKVKRDKAVSRPSLPAIAKLRSVNDRTLSFLISMNIRSVPTAVIFTKNQELKIIRGEHEILRSISELLQES